MAEADKEKQLVVEEGGNQQKSPEQAEEAPSGSKKKLIILLIVLLILVLGGLLVAKHLEDPPSGPPPLKLGKIVPLNDFLVNLDDGQSYLKTSIDVQLASDYSSKKFDAELPIVRDAVISVLSSQTSSFVNTLQGKEVLKQQIAAAINAVLDPANRSGSQANLQALQAARAKKAHPGWDADIGPVLMVYFTDFVTQ